jgi:hypothetical protein
MNCLLDFSNCVFFKPDNIDITIDVNSALGWYVLFSKKNSNPQLILRSNVNQYIGYSTFPPTPDPDCPEILVKNFGVGKCSLVFLSVEEANNIGERKEKNEGIKYEYGNYAGRVISPKRQSLDTKNVQHYGFIKIYESFDIYGLDVDLDTTNAKFVEIEYRISTVDSLIPSFVFGTPINLQATEMKYDPVEEFNFTTTGTILTVNYTGDLVSSFTLTNTSPFEVILENKKEDLRIVNVFVELLEDVGDLRIDGNKIYINSGLSNTVNVTVINNKNYYFKPEIVI